VTSLEFLFSLERLGMKFGLENMMTICAALDHPERSFRSVIVAGTNGKGSVTAMVSAALHAAGIRSARYTSPHLERIEERFVIGEEEVSTADLAGAAAAVQQTVEALVRQGTLEALPTFFECATAIAFELFRRASVEVAAIEVGLGGRLDATNVLSPMAAAITSIDFDHEALLGSTLTAIAREKAGVIKPGIPVVIGPLPREADDVVAAVCRERGADLIRSRDRVRVERIDESADADVTVTTAVTRLEAVRLALRGRHQLDNAAVAVGVLEALLALGVSLGSGDIRAGLEQARWPGRLEAAQWRGADVLLDAAHNAAGARALAAYLRDIGWTSITLVIGVMHDKDAHAILAALAPLAATIICTTAPSPRAMAAFDLAALAGKAASAPDDVRAIADPEAALTAACRPGTRVVACGSIFLIGPLRGILR
jgi:dihydrofolate synthase/folylpolyglutamate synthase